MSRPFPKRVLTITGPIFVEDAEPGDVLKVKIESIELEQIHNALDLADGIISEAARLLTLKRTTLIEKMRKYGVQQQAA